ncbi:SwmB domain-containing protein [Candidatus Poriferisodalis sp.]|uniref:SwmB domain-containing protein n=1 Tax=Candidatus Poriferisodalis sp. TaxID=3101277 RepID=UPI003B52F392
MTYEKRGERTLRVDAAAVSMGAPARTLRSVRSVRCCRRVGRFAVAAVIAGAAVVAGVLPVSAQVLSPALSSVSVNGSALSLMFSDSLDEASLPPATSFAVTVSGASRDVTGVGIGGHAVTLTLADAAQAGEVVLVSYTVPSSNPVRGAGLVAVAAFADAAAVNGTAPRAPVLSGAVIDGHLVRLTYDEYLLDLGTNSLASGFTVTVGGVDRSVLSATVTPSAGIDYVTYVNLVVAIAVQVGESVLVSYDPPASDPIQDVGGTPAAAYTDRSATNTTSQTKPGLLAAVIRGSAVTLTFSETLDTGSVPPAESFRFEVEGVERDVTDVTVGATEVSLTVAGEMQAGQHARISYTDASSGPIRDLEHAIPAVVFTNYAVINGTAARAPLLVTATVNASTVTLTYDEDLDTASTPPATSFEVTVSGTARPVQSAAVRGRTVVVVLVSPPVEPDQEVRVEYDAAASSPIRDIGGTPAAIVDRLATRSTSSPAPELHTATVNASTVTLTYDEDLDTASAPSATSFEVTVSGTARPVQSAAVRGKTVVVTLETPVQAGQAVQLSYTVPTSSPIQDLGGTPAGPLTDHSVANTTTAVTKPTTRPTGGGGGSGGGGLEESTAVVIVANGWSPADIGVAAALSARTPDSAVVYTAGDRLSVAARDLLVDYLPAGVIVVGGEAVVSDAALVSMRRASESDSVERITGATRTDTAAGVARRILDAAEEGGATVIIANGWSPADIGVAAALSARTPRSSVAYTASGALSAATERLLRDHRPARVLVVGGEAAVSPAAVAEIRAAVPGATVERVSGATRTGTAAGAARRFLGPHQGAATDELTVIVANGWSPPDIGVAAALSARTAGSVVLYTEAGRLSAEAAEVLRDYQPTRVVFVGGPAAITAEAKAQASAIVPDATAPRYSGATRTHTAAAVARRTLGRP